MYSFGEKNGLLINVEIDQVFIEERIVLCGIEIWIEGNCFGDINYIDILGGGVYDMVIKLQEKNIPLSDLFTSKSESQIFDSIYKNFIGVTIEDSNWDLKQTAEHGRFWSNFVLSPNGAMQFDKWFIFYYKEGDYVRFFYQFPATKEVKSSKFPSKYVDKISAECISFFNGLFVSSGVGL